MSLSPFLSEKTVKTPFVSFDPISGNFEMRGKSIPENTISFYKPILDWLNEYAQNPAPKTTLTVQLDYFNTSTSKCLVDIFKKVEMVITNNKGEVVINWMYDENDEDMMEAGDDFKSTVKIPFSITSFVKED